MNFRKITLTAVAALTAVSIAAPAFAQPYGDDNYRSDDRGSYSDDRGSDDRYDDRGRGDRYDSRYDSDRNDSYQDYYRNGRYDRRQYDRYDGRERSNCRDNRVAGTILGAIGGAVVGSNVDNRGSRNDGAAIGAFLGGLAGNSIASNSRACDEYGHYYSYQQTYPYRTQRGYRGRYSDYGRRGCRLAVADDGYGRGQYVTVCPDRYGRYRVRY